MFLCILLFLKDYQYIGLHDQYQSIISWYDAAFRDIFTEQVSTQKSICLVPVIFRKIINNYFLMVHWLSSAKLIKDIKM